MAHTSPTVLDVVRAVTELTDSHQDRQNKIARGQLPTAADMDRITEALHRAARNVSYQRQRAGVIERSKYSASHARAVLSALGADGHTVQAYSHELAKLVRNTFG